ncbi:MAG TPA: galactose-1-phosphate uridylyltransferase, partial [Candidatus Saccharimonadales bacterium]|nr:galactose-1-phosphate uridylyltransferase [Candidatus Saccharimonadales bacterium]
MPESTTHTRRNLLTGAEILVTAGRLKRPWQGQRTTADEPERPPHDPSCYLCPGNLRSEGQTRNPRYTSTYCFTNDFSALQGHTAALPSTGSALLQWAPERGICEVVIYSPRHDLTMANMTLAQIVSVIKLWQGRYQALLQRDDLAYVQIFQNEQMGSSNPHPHGQIWATENLLGEPELEDTYQRLHYDRW